MRKLYILIAAFAITASVNAQSQRLVMVEEFTGETCGPCAAYNPGFKAIMDANPTKGIYLKYQNDIPSPGPNFYAYNTADIATRTGFYGNNYSPHGFMDGNVWDDNIANFTATMLNNQYAVSSPFSIAVSHTLSALEDSIHAHIVVTASQAVNNANLKLQVAIAEQEVFGYTSPNGEDVYTNVMRKMLPDANGTTMAGTWTNGQSATFDLSWKIAASPTSYPGPLPVQLRVIAFIQDGSTKNILQSGADRNMVTLDPSIGPVTNVPAITCANSITPTVEITNAGSTTLTTLDIQYTLDANPMQTFNWTGSLVSGATTTATLPAIAVSSQGAHSLLVTLVNPNGSPDQVPSNSSATVGFAVPTSVTNVTQAFAGNQFPPTNWLVENPDNGYTWTRASVGLAGAGSAKIDFYNSTAGNIDILDIAEGVNFTGATNPSLTFDVAHRQYSANENDLLEVQASTDCGATWATVWTKAGPTLSTVSGYVTSAFSPTATQWRNENVSLSAYTGQTNVLLRFYAASEFGNNAFIDNVNISLATAIDADAFANAVSVYPNPAHNQVNVNVSLETAQAVDITLMDLTGKVIQVHQVNGGVFTKTLALDKVAAGTYLIKVAFEGNTTVKKFTVE